MSSSLTCITAIIGKVCIYETKHFSFEAIRRVSTRVEAKEPRSVAIAGLRCVFEALLERYSSLRFSRDVFARLAAYSRRVRSENQATIFIQQNSKIPSRSHFIGRSLGCTLLKDADGSKRTTMWYRYMHLVMYKRYGHLVSTYIYQSLGSNNCSNVDPVIFESPRIN